MFKKHDIEKLKFDVGEKYIYSYKVGLGRSRKTVYEKCTIVQDEEDFVTIDLGKYRTTVQKVDILIGDVGLDKRVVQSA